MAKRKNGPSWFKVFYHNFPTVRASSDAAVGSAFKAALRYLDSGELPQLEGDARLIFEMLRSQVEEADADYQRSSAAGKKAMEKRWHGVTEDKPLITPSIEADAEAEAEADAEADAEAGGSRRGAPAHQAPPTVEMVSGFCKQRGFDSVDPERFVSYYTSIGWKVGRNPITDWQSAVVAWARSDRAKPRGKPKEQGLDRLARLYQEEFRQ